MERKTHSTRRSNRVPELDDKKRENMVNELIALIIRRSGVPRRKIYDRAIRSFCLNNMDLLTPEELQKYDSVIL